MIASVCTYDSEDDNKETVVEPGIVIDQIQPLENDQQVQAVQNLQPLQPEPQLKAGHILDDNIVHNQPIQENQNSPKPLSIPHVGDEILYRKKGNDDWTKAKILSKGGKTSGKNWAYLNIQNEDTDKQSGIDFAKDIEEWHNVNDVDLE